MTTSKRPQIALIIMIQMALMVPIACLSGPNCDELAHLASGLYHWQTGRFDAYCVNPPLHRMWCTLPIAAAIPNIDWCAPSTATGYRLEWSLSHQLLDVVSPSTLRVYLVAARLMNLPPVMLGGIVCFLWSESRYGTHAGRAALVMWCFSPNVLSWGVGLCPGIAAASLGATACYCFGHWLNRDSWKLTLTSGFLLGLAVLTKATWILLLVTSPLIIVASRWLHGPQPRIRRGLVLLATGLLVIYLGYGLDRPWTRLADQTFQSQFFRDVRQNAMSLLPAPTLLFLPLPESLVVGMDQQKHDFEEGKWSFLCGKWRHGGWLTYYAICAGLKMPLGFWCLVAVALVVQLSSLQKRGCQLRAAACVPSLALYIPPIAVGLLVSSQTGFSRHFRYLFPCLPFAFVWAGQAAAVTHRSLRLVTFASLAWLTTSSLATWPLCHAYFNELAGGPGNGYRFLLDSNVDWGEDVLLAEDWIGQHPEARPAFRVFVTDEFAAHRTCPWLEAPETLIPGWYLASVHRVMDPSDRFTVLRQFTPVDRIGYSTFVFHLTADQIERTRVAFATDSSENHGSIRQFAWQTTTGNTAHDAIQENTHRTPELAIGRILTLLCVAGVWPATALANTWRIELSAGESDRQQTPVSVPVSDASISAEIDSATSAVLVDAETDAEIAVQLTRIPVPQIAWVLQRPLAANTRREYDLKLTGKVSARAQPLVECVSDDGNLEVRANRRPVFRYQVAVKRGPEGSDALQARNAYIHPVYSPCGQVITDDFAPDHVHQRGLFFAWTQCKFQDHDLNFWEVQQGTGKIVHKELSDVESGDVFAQFVARHEFLDTHDPSKPQTVLSEKWTVRVYNLPDGFLFDLKSDQTCVADDPLKVGPYHYGGMAVRGRREWISPSGQNSFSMITNEGLNREQGNHSRPAWIDFGGQLNGRPVGLLSLCHPGNFRFPQTVRLHPSKPYFCFAPLVDGQFEIAPQQTLTSQYRFLVYSGSKNAHRSSRLWHDYATPPSVRISRSSP